MLNDEQQVWLVKQLVATAEVLGTQISPTAAAMLAEDLSRYEQTVLNAALARVRSESPTRLTPKVIIEAIDAAMGRPGANEAWAVALSAMDERNTVVWTEEIAQAWEVARPVVRGGDEIGGRMAFKDSYERLVRTARDERRMPVVTVSFGDDADLRAPAVEKAVKLGYMPGEQAVRHGYMPLALAISQGYVSPSQAKGLALLGNEVLCLPPPDGMGAIETVMQTGDLPGDAPPAVRARLLELREELVTGKVRHAKAAAERAAKASADLATRKAAAQSMADNNIDPAAEIRRAEWAVVWGRA
jgi:hypothetical protein